MTPRSWNEAPFNCLHSEYDYCKKSHLQKMIRLPPLWLPVTHSWLLSSSTFVWQMSSQAQQQGNVQYNLSLEMLHVLSSSENEPWIFRCILYIKCHEQEKESALFIYFSEPRSHVNRMMFRGFKDRYLPNDFFLITALLFQQSQKEHPCKKVFSK